MRARRIKLEGQFTSASSAEPPAINFKFVLTMLQCRDYHPVASALLFGCMRGSGWQGDQCEHVLA